ncbi:putative ribonuclease H-like domain-containing protein [Tanacetum coccineum]
MRPFGCPVTILNTIDHLGKFDGKADEGFFVGYSLNSKAFIVFNSRTRIVEENLHIRFSESIHNIVGSGPNWLFDIDALTGIMNYKPIVAGTQSNGFADPKSSHDDESKPSSDNGKKVDEDPRKESECYDQEKEDNVNSTNNVNIVSSTVNATGTNEVNVVGGNISIELPFDPKMPVLEDDNIFDFSSDDDDDGAVADMNNLDTTIQVSPIPTTRIHKDHPLDQEEPKKVIHALKDPSWIEAMNKKDEMGIVIRNKERLVTQGYTQKEGIDYDEVFFLVARIEAIRLFLAYASFKDFVVYQMDVKSAFLYGKIKKEVYVCQPPGFENPDFLDRVYKVKKHYMVYIKLLELHMKPFYVDDIIFGSTEKELCTAFEKLMDEKFQMSSMGELTLLLGLQVKQKKDGIFICQDKYVAKILKRFGFIEVKTASTPIETQKPLLKGEDGEEVDVHMYRYLKGQPRLGLWYPKDSLFELVAYTDSDYAGASLDMKSTT